MAAVPSIGFLEAFSVPLSRMGQRLPPTTPLLITSVAALTLGRGPAWVPTLFSHYTAALPPAPATPPPAPSVFSQDTVPRRIAYRQLREALIKATILVGVPKVIETSLALDQHVASADPGAKCEACVRDDLVDADVGQLFQRGDAGLRRAYKEDIGGIWDQFGPGMRDIQFISRAITYGVFLYPVADSPTTPGAALTLKETQIVTLTVLLCQRVHKLVLWHLRGSLRAGFDQEEVEAIQQAIEICCEELGVPKISEGMPRVTDVKEF